MSDDVVSTIDLAASLASLTGIKLSKDACLDSFDVTGALLGEPGAKGRDYVLQQDNAGANFGLRWGRWKLVRQRTQGKKPAGAAYRELLFDLQADPGESKDVALEHPDELRRLHDLLEKVLNSQATRANT